ncbi:ABC transporter ATP-binding protein [Anaerofilum sp. BX8]|uniref:ABC transporter ATP-binding protein n=1 Tax=Anaerofilum hominis TaxID=2763016 RepID=A0A923L268_9FIRM|nr:ABC transporter ATP-binding protein [Anaerofilum hominis]MBC5582490.1 ABC transporter ATP-binding protein [Anaerofilum hominis]
MHLLELNQVSVSYDAVSALQECSIYIDEGEMISIVGSNGAGKTTVCKAISGVLDIRGGEVSFDGKDITKVPGYDRVELGIIQCPEGRHLFPDMTVMENLEMGAYCKRGRRDAGENLKYVLGLFPLLEERSGQAARTLSGGEQQMLAIGRSLMSDPRLLILDEPSLGLSPVNVQLIFSKLGEIRARGTTILLVEQNVEKSLRNSDRGYALENGRIVLTGTGKELLENEDLKRVYLGM